MSTEVPGVFKNAFKEVDLAPNPQLAERVWSAVVPIDANT